MQGSKIFPGRSICLVWIDLFTLHCPNKDRICSMFDSFCKTVSRNFVRNLDRAEGNQDNQDKHFPTNR